MKFPLRGRASIAWLVCIIGFAPVGQADEKPFDLKQARAEIEDVNRRYCDVLRKGDAAALARFFTTDAKSMGPNEPAHEGRAKIEAVYAGYIAEGATELSLTTRGVWGNEEMLAEEGVYAFANMSGKELDRGKYIVLWKKIEGEWQLFRDCYNSDLPLPAAK